MHESFWLRLNVLLLSALLQCTFVGLLTWWGAIPFSHNIWQTETTRTMRRLPLRSTLTRGLVATGQPQAQQSANGRRQVSNAPQGHISHCILH